MGAHHEPARHPTRLPRPSPVDRGIAGSLDRRAVRWFAVSDAWASWPASLWQPRSVSPGHDVLVEPPSPREEKARQRWRAERQRLRAEERRARKRRDDEFRERMLRQRIAEGKDERDDKYLHSAARRRRQEAASPLPAVSGVGASR